MAQIIPNIAPQSCTPGERIFFNALKKIFYPRIILFGSSQRFLETNAQHGQTL
jgi:hypothetical protein